MESRNWQLTNCDRGVGLIYKKKENCDHQQKQQSDSNMGAKNKELEQPHHHHHMSCKRLVIIRGMFILTRLGELVSDTFFSDQNRKFELVTPSLQFLAKFWRFYAMTNRFPRVPFYIYKEAKALYLARAFCRDPIKISLLLDGPLVTEKNEGLAVKTAYLSFLHYLPCPYLVKTLRRINIIMFVYAQPLLVFKHKVQDIKTINPVRNAFSINAFFYLKLRGKYFKI